MSVEQVAQTYYRRSQAHQRSVVAALLALWRQTGPSGFRDVAVQAAGLLAAGQLVAAVNAARYALDVAAEQNLTDPPLQITPRSFAGVAANGSDLVSLITLPTVRVWTELDGGADFATARQSGTATLTRIAGNEVEQAGNNAVHMSLTANPAFLGYVRMLQTPSCSRCAVLAGRWYEWSSGFDRHDNCDCVHVPAADVVGVDDLRTDPDQYFRSLTVQQQDSIFGKANAQAIRDGSDIGQVVNASTRPSALYSFGPPGARMRATTEGTTIRQGRAGRRMAVTDQQVNARAPLAGERAQRPRLTPVSIYKLAGSDRNRAIQLLFDNGYLESRSIRRSNAALLADTAAAAAP